MVDSVDTIAWQNLSRLLANELISLPGVNDQTRSVREAVNHSRDMAYTAEDIVDTYAVNVNMHRSRNMLVKYFHSRNQVVNRKLIAMMSGVRELYEKTYKNNSIYGIHQGDFECYTRNKEFAKDSLIVKRRDVEEEEVVGMVRDSNEVISQLEGGDLSRGVVCILGMGGLGKTTLARKIYNNNKIKSMFPCCVWGFVSNYYSAQELLMSILKLLDLPEEEYKYLTNPEQMKRKVRESMSGKKYLVVLDDIWYTQVWDELHEAFPDDNNGSRILITIRMENISRYTNATFTYRLPFLDETQSWELFYNKVFCKARCPPELEPAGKEMAKACKGLPLAIVVFAGMVAKKEKSLREWDRIKNNVSWYHTREDYRIVTDILKLSYDSLPQILKPCFLYLGVYPEDYEIPARTLCQLWIAEGFIQAREATEAGPSNSQEVEDIAEMYLDNLVERSLVQVASKRSDEGVKTCRVHALLREICISESKENKFMEVCEELDANRCNSRRVSLQYKGECLPTTGDKWLARSLLFFGEETPWERESQGWKQIRNGFKLGRVLDMNQVSLCLSPRGLKTLIHLRFLKVTASSTRIGNDVLASVCNLWNLETLYLWITEDITLPSKIWKLKSLRHLYLNFADIILRGLSQRVPMPGMEMVERANTLQVWSRAASMSRMKIGETKVENLQTLNNIYLNARTASVLNKGMFPNLTKLTLRRELTDLPEPPEKEFLGNSLRCLNKLRTLKLLRIAKLPLDPNAYPTSLTKITIAYFGLLHARMIKTLGQLANLRTLKLVGGSIIGDVDCVAGDFPQLQVLHVSDSCRWKKEEGAMPQLRYCNNPRIHD